MKPHEDPWMDAHSCSFEVKVPVTLTLQVDGYDTDDVDDLAMKIDDMICNLCEVLYKNRRTRFFLNMSVDSEQEIER